MVEYFVRDYTGGPFQLLSPGHLIALAVIVGINGSLFYFGKSLDHRGCAYIRYGLAALMLTNEAAWHLWNWLTGLWSIQTMLPLHISSLMVYLSAFTLITGSTRWHHLIYFLGVSTSMQPLITPDVSIYGFPHFRVFQTFIGHGGIFTTGCYIIFVRQYIPSWKSMVKAAITAALYLIFMGMVNTLIGSNYLFLARKPEASTVLDIFGPWPWYILGMVGLGSIVFLLLYSPFAIKALKRARCNG